MILVQFKTNPLPSLSQRVIHKLILHEKLTSNQAVNNHKIQSNPNSFQSIKIQLNSLASFKFTSNKFETHKILSNIPQTSIENIAPKI